MQLVGSPLRMASAGLIAQLYGGGVSAGASVAPLKQATGRDTRTWKEWFGGVRARADADIDALAKQGYLVNRLTSLHGLLELASITEAGTRNSIFDTVYKEKQRQGLSEYEAMIEAAYQAQDILDFSRWGSKTLAVRALTPFVNAHIQGLDKARRTLFEPLWREAITTGDAEAKRNAVASLTKVFAVGGALGAAWAALHHADDIYQDAKAEMKGTHFVTTIGGKIFVIPKPFELSIGFTAGEFAYQQLVKDDPRAAAQFAEAAYEVLMPPVPVFANPLIKTSYELKSNYSTFTGRAIVPDRLQRLDTAYQYTDRTSSFAKALGATIGVSPIKVEYAAGSFFAVFTRKS
jgi:hypothetical protein